MVVACLYLLVLFCVALATLALTLVDVDAGASPAACLGLVASVVGLAVVTYGVGMIMMEKRR